MQRLTALHGATHTNRNALAMKADCKEAFTYLGAALQKEAPDAAVPKFKCALELDPQYKPALLGMGSTRGSRHTDHGCHVLPASPG